MFPRPQGVRSVRMDNSCLLQCGGDSGGGDDGGSGGGGGGD